MILFNNILAYINNLVKNGTGVDRDLFKLIADKDINRAKELFQNRDEEVLQAIKEYNPELHRVMLRRDKYRKGRDPYVVQKLPRAWQRYINLVSLHFLLSKDIIWREIDSSDLTEVAFKEFKSFLKTLKFNTALKRLKEFAGAETEAAIIFHVYNENGSAKVRCMTIAKSLGYTLRPLFDEFGNMLAFAYGYNLNENGKTVEHFDILTDNIIYRSKKTGLGWDVEAVNNPIGKIPVVYVKQQKEWEGVERRIERDEELDSKTGDINNYFADPKLFVSTDVIKNNMLPDVEMPGQVLQGLDSSSFVKYIEPPTSTEMKDGEKKNIRESILTDSLTPDFTYENMKGTGTLSGEALRRALILGYIKRGLRMEVYNDVVERSKNIIIAIMINVTHISLSRSLSVIKMEHEFPEPFEDDQSAVWASIGRAYTDGIISIETAVSLLGVANPIEEVERIKAEKQSRQEEMFFPVG